MALDTEGDDSDGVDPDAVRARARFASVIEFNQKVNTNTKMKGYQQEKKAL